MSSRNVGHQPRKVQQSHTGATEVPTKGIAKVKTMRGLQNFITEVRGVQTKQQEAARVRLELSKIKKSLERSRPSSYDKKKYVCKLLYCFIIGYDVDVGRAAAVQLLSAKNFSEKQIGYLAVGLLLNENHELMTLLVNSMLADLKSNNPPSQALALSAIANVGGRQMADAVADVVANLLMSNETGIWVKKKAALCLLRMFRKHPEVVTPEFLLRRMEGLLTIYHPGLLLSVVGLIYGMAEVSPDVATLAPFISQIVKIHERVLSHDESNIAKNYRYYDVPAPWLQIKILRFLRFFPNYDNEVVLESIRSIVMRLLDTPEPDPSARPANRRTIVRAVKTEAALLAIAFGRFPELLQKSFDFLTAPTHSSTSRCMNIGCLVMLCSVSPDWQRQVFNRCYHLALEGLHSSDTNESQRCVDLLYMMCVEENTMEIIKKMLEILATDIPYQVKENMAAKVFNLADQLSSSNAQWSIHVMLTLLRLAGECMPDAAFQRLVALVEANPALHENSARAAFQSLQAVVQQRKVSDCLSKVCAILFSRYGSIIANQPGTGAWDQFDLLHQSFPLVYPSARVILLTAYVAFARLYPDLLMGRVKSMLEEFRNAPDEIVRNRAGEMLYALQSQQGIPQPQANQYQQQPQHTSPMSTQNPAQQMLDAQNRMATMSVSTSPQTATILAPEPARQAPEPAHQALESQPPQDNIPIDDDAFHTICAGNDGVMYQDSNLQIGFQGSFDGSNHGSLNMFFGNMSPHEVKDVSISMSCDGLRISITAPPSIPSMQQVMAPAAITCESEYSGVPLMSLSYSPGGGAPVDSALLVPVPVLRFASAYSLPLEQFHQLWSQMTGAPTELRLAVPVTFPPSSSHARQVMTFQLKMDEVREGSSSPNAVTFSSTFVSAKGQAVILAAVEAEAHNNQYVVTVKSVPQLSAALGRLAYIFLRKQQ